MKTAKYVAAGLLASLLFCGTYSSAVVYTTDWEDDRSSEVSNLKVTRVSVIEGGFGFPSYIMVDADFSGFLGSHANRDRTIVVRDGNVIAEYKPLPNEQRNADHWLETRENLFNWMHTVNLAPGDVIMNGAQDANITEILIVHGLK